LPGKGKERNFLIYALKRRDKERSDTPIRRQRKGGKQVPPATLPKPSGIGLQKKEEDACRCGGGRQFLLLWRNLLLKTKGKKNHSKRKGARKSLLLDRKGFDLDSRGSYFFCGKEGAFLYHD